MEVTLYLSWKVAGLLLRDYCFACSLVVLLILPGFPFEEWMGDPRYSIEQCRAKIGSLWADEFGHQVL